MFLAESKDPELVEVAHSTHGERTKKTMLPFASEQNGELELWDYAIWLT